MFKKSWTIEDIKQKRKDGRNLLSSLKDITEINKQLDYLSNNVVEEELPEELEEELPEEIEDEKLSYFIEKELPEKPRVFKKIRH